MHFDNPMYNNEEFRRDFERRLSEPDKVNPIKKWALRILCPLIVFGILYSFYTGNMDFLIYAKYKGIVYVVLIFVVLPVSACVSCCVWMKDGINHGLSIALILFFVHGPLAVYWTKYHEMESYLTSGVKTKAVVIESFYSKGPRLMYQFQVDEKIYTSFRYKDIGGHRKGDTLEIIYYRKEPVMNTSIELYMEDLKD